MPADGLVTQPFIHGEHRQVFDDDVWVAGLRVGVLFCAVVGECVYPRLVCLFGGASDVAIDKLLGRGR